MSHIQLDRWHTSEIKFPSEAAAKACHAALVQLSGEQITVHNTGATVLFEGQFDFSAFDDEFKDIVAAHLTAPTKYAVKSIFNDEDGYFGGFTLIYNDLGEMVESVCLNSTFESLD